MLYEVITYEIDSGLIGIYYSYHIITQGYTHLGQMLGAGIGPGSDSEILKVDYFDSWGSVGIFLQRIGWNLMYLYQDPSTRADPEGADYLRLNTELNLGFTGVLVARRDFHFTSYNFV